MQWWTDFLDWLNSDSGWRIISTAVIPFVAIVVAGACASDAAKRALRRCTVERWDHSAALQRFERVAVHRLEGGHVG